MGPGVVLLKCGLRRCLKKGEYLRLYNLGEVPVAVQSALNTYEVRSVVVTNGAPNHHTRCLSAMPLNNAALQVALTTVPPDTYAAITVGHVEAGLVRKDDISPPYGKCSRTHCSRRRLWCMDNGSRRNGVRATSPTFSRRRRTVDADKFTPVAVLQRRVNTVYEAVRSVLAMQTM